MRAIELWHGISWDKISSFDCYPEDESGDAVIQQGYDTLYNDLLAEADDNLLEIITGAEVVNITRSQGQVSICTKSGQEYASDFAIITIPIGVLKERHTTIFKGCEIPPDLTKAMEVATVATLGKVAFFCHEAFWDKTFERAIVLPVQLDQDLNTSQESMEVPPAPKTMPLFFQNGVAVYNKPVLLALMGEPLTRHLEAHPEETMKYFGPALELLRADKAKPLPKIDYVVTDWSVNPFFRCSYSAATVGETVEENVESFLRGCGRIRFAGEHTVVQGNGCVHGAFASGRREAEHIIQITMEWIK
jgi:polyamine oxidase